MCIYISCQMLMQCYFEFKGKKWARSQEDGAILALLLWTSRDFSCYLTLRALGCMFVNQVCPV